MSNWASTGVRLLASFVVVSVLLAALAGWFFDARKAAIFVGLSMVVESALVLIAANWTRSSLAQELKDATNTALESHGSIRDAVEHATAEEAIAWLADPDDGASDEEFARIAQERMMRRADRDRVV